MEIFKQAQPKIWTWKTSIKTKSQFAFQSWKPFFQAFFVVEKTLKILIFLKVRAFDLITKLRPRPKYQLSCCSKIIHILLLYLVLCWDFFSSINHFWLCAAVHNCFWKKSLWSAWQSSSDRRMITKRMKIILWSRVLLNNCYFILGEQRNI